MDDKQNPEDLPQSEQGTQPEPGDNQPTQGMPKGIARWLENLTRFGLGDLLFRFGTHALAIVLILGAVWLMRTFYQPQAAAASGSQPAVSEETDMPPMVSPAMPVQAEANLDGIPRLALLHTNIPSRPRIEIIEYIVQAGDTVFGIAEKFGLSPETILWGNYYILRDDPHNLRPGQTLNILPVNGTYYEWHAGDGLNGVASYFGVEPEVILNFPGNHLDPENIGDLANPNIATGTWLVIPDGTREFISWSAPVGVTRDNPAIARVLGPGACGSISGGAVGFGSFIWPANQHFLSGNDYSPQSNHRGIDIDGETGDPVYATDAGVIVYAGWNDYGYGYMIMIDHGAGWQSLYAHLSAINVACGQSVGQGDVIGAIGSTGNSTGSHLHFELMHTEYGKVNPWNFLPAP